MKLNPRNESMRGAVPSGRWRRGGGATAAKCKLASGRLLPCLVYASLVLGIAGGALAAAARDGLVEFIGEQRRIFTNGNANRSLELKSLEGRPDLYGIGPVEGLDGEITILNSAAYVSKVRGADYVVDRSFDHGAIFFVMAENRNWRDVPVPANVRTYRDLQIYVKAQAAAAGIDTVQPFPFLITGRPAGLTWHINVDLTEGKPITRELFVKSKKTFVAKGEQVDIVGFHSERHQGVFISQSAPALQATPDVKNTIHIHFVSRDSKATGHVDDLELDGGVTLRLPATKP